MSLFSKCLLWVVNKDFTSGLQSWLSAASSGLALFGKITISLARELLVGGIKYHKASADIRNLFVKVGMVLLGKLAVSSVNNAPVCIGIEPQYGERLDQVAG